MVAPLLRPTSIGIDDKGQEVILVPLGKPGASAKIDKETFKRFSELGLSFNWWLYEGRSVRVRHGRWPNLAVSRLIVNAQKGTMVRHKDRNCLNLLPDNLVLKTGRGGSKEFEALLAMERAKTARDEWEAKFAGMGPFERLTAEIAERERLGLLD